MKNIIITLGGKGYEIINKTLDKIYPCIKVKSVDTTSAGDTFCGGLLACLSQEIPLEESAIFASKSASIACTKKGAQPSIPTKQEVLNFKG